nr:reverse transcriptase domain-containing protein [Tanacetum cinerariifolium]
KSTSLVESDIQTNATMADNRTMTQMLQAPIEGYEDAIVVPPINANNFELKQTLINLVQSNQFTGRQDPHNYLRFFNKIAAALEDKLDIRMNRFEKSLNEMKNSIVTPTAPLKNLYNKPSTSSSSSLPSNTILNPKGETKAITTRSGMSYKEPPIPPTGVNQQQPVEGEAKAITTRSGMSYKEPPIPPPGVNQQKPIEITKDTEPQNSDDIHPSTVQAEVPKDKPADEHVVVIPTTKPNLPYPFRLQKEKN